MSKLYFYKSHITFYFYPSPHFFFHHFHSYTKILTLIPFIPTPNSLHSHPASPHFHSYFPHSHLIPRISTPISHIPIILTLIPRIPITPNLISRIPIIPFIPFPNSPFQLLQITSLNLKLARKLLNQIFTQSKQPFISSFDCNMCLELRPRMHLTSWI